MNSLPIQRFSQGKAHLGNQIACVYSTPAHVIRLSSIPEILQRASQQRSYSAFPDLAYVCKFIISISFNTQLQTLAFMLGEQSQRSSKGSVLTFDRFFFMPPQS
jgi:hypothetical protein